MYKINNIILFTHPLFYLSFLSYTLEAQHPSSIIKYQQKNYKKYRHLYHLNFVFIFRWLNLSQHFLNFKLKYPLINL